MFSVRNFMELFQRIGWDGTYNDDNNKNNKTDKSKSKKIYVYSSEIKKKSLIQNV